MDEKAVALVRHHAVSLHDNQFVDEPKRTTWLRTSVASDWRLTVTQKEYEQEADERRKLKLWWRRWQAANTFVGGGKFELW
jgi:hypothetical protein